MLSWFHFSKHCEGERFLQVILTIPTFCLVGLPLLFHEISFQGIALASLELGDLPASTSPTCWDQRYVLPRPTPFLMLVCEVFVHMFCPSPFILFSDNIVKLRPPCVMPKHGFCRISNNSPQFHLSLALFAMSACGCPMPSSSFAPNKTFKCLTGIHLSAFPFLASEFACVLNVSCPGVGSVCSTVGFEFYCINLYSSMQVTKARELL